MRVLLAALSLCVLWAGNLPADAQSDQWDGMVRIASAAAVGAPIRSAGRVVGSRPAGCPRRYCGCASAKYLGIANPGGRLNLAANWLRFPRARPGPGMAAARRGHVFVIKSVVGPGQVLAYDPNSGGGKTRVVRCSRGTRARTVPAVGSAPRRSCARRGTYQGAVGAHAWSGARGAATRHGCRQLTWMPFRRSSCPTRTAPWQGFARAWSIVGHRLEYPPPQAFGAPATEAPKHTVPIAKRLWKIPPGRPCPHKRESLKSTQPRLGNCEPGLPRPSQGSIVLGTQR